MFHSIRNGRKFVLACRHLYHIYGHLTKLLVRRKCSFATLLVWSMYSQWVSHCCKGTQQNKEEEKNFSFERLRAVDIPHFQYLFSGGICNELLRVKTLKSHWAMNAASHGNPSTQFNFRFDFLRCLKCGLALNDTIFSLWAFLFSVQVFGYAEISQNSIESNGNMVWALVFHFLCIHFRVRLICTCEGCASMSWDRYIWIRSRNSNEAATRRSVLQTRRNNGYGKCKEPGEQNLIKCASSMCLFHTENGAFYGACV